MLPTKATNLRERLMPNASSAQVAMSDSNGIKRNVVCRPSSSAPANSNLFYRHASKQARDHSFRPGSAHPCWNGVYRRLQHAIFSYIANILEVGVLRGTRMVSSTFGSVDEALSTTVNVSSAEKTRS